MAQDLLDHLMEDWDEDVRLPEVLDLKTLKILRSEVRNLKPLTSLCLRNVVMNVDNVWYKDYFENLSDQDVAFLLGPFDDLPGSLATAVMQTMRDMKKLQLRYLLLLITCHIEILDLSNIKASNKVLVAIKYRCQENLKSLNLEGCKGLSTSCLKDTLASLSKIQVLNLKHVGIGDDVLATLGSNNEQLSELYLCYNLKVTNAGIKSLCIDDGHVGKCKKLRVLTLESTKVDEAGLQCALENLPNLVMLEHISIVKAALQWYETHGESTLKLQKMTVDIACISDGYIEPYSIVAMCPDLRILEIQSSIGRTHLIEEGFLGITNLAKFKLENCYIPDIPWFLYIGHDLTELNLVGENFEDKIDLTMVGQTCLKLEKLNIQEITLIESEKNTNPIPYEFTLVKTVSLGNKKLGPNVDSNLSNILCSKHLQSCKLTGFEFSDELFSSVLLRTSYSKETFSQIEEIEFSDCSEVTEKTLKTVICCSPKLMKIGMNHCEKFSKADECRLSKFLHDNKLNINLQWN